MFRVHCFTDYSYIKYNKDFPENTYETNNLDKVQNIINNCFKDNTSGINHIIIEKGNFMIHCNNPMNLD